MNIMDMDFDKTNGLIPAIVQDADTKNVLMLGYMNREAFEQTQNSGKVTFSGPAVEHGKSNHSAGAGANLNVPAGWRLNNRHHRKRQPEMHDDTAEHGVHFSRLHRASADTRRLRNSTD